MTATLAESVTGIREIQGFAREQVSGGPSRRWSIVTRGVNMVAHRNAAIVQPLLEWNGQLFLSIVLVVGGYQALGGGVSLAALIQFLFLSNAPVRGDPEHRQPVQPGADRDGGGRAGLRAAGHAARLAGPAGRDAARRRVRGGSSCAASRSPTSRGGRCCTSFAWRCRPGSTVAVVGHTGSGQEHARQPGRQALPADGGRSC